MLKLLAASRKRPGLTRADYQRYIEFYHGTLSRKERGSLREYIQNHVIDGAFGTLSDPSYDLIADRDAVVELKFDNFRDMINALEPQQPNDLSEDGHFFADEPNSITVMAEEEEIPVANPLPEFNPGLGLVKNVGGLKVLHYVMREDSVYPEDFSKYWRDAHFEALEKSAYAKSQLRRCVANWRLRLNDNDAAARKHFKMIDPPVYNLVSAHWYDSIEQAGAFREYHENLMKNSNKFANWSKSFFLFTKQVVIIRDTEGFKHFD
ncbi:EthD domain-containing protein [Citrobacter sp. Cb004]|uniref:EthD domain-containing protein n=1 Tax=Citrobacter sp. Cb004 TaxID=2985006 RepID=UPI0025749058|nr:EthD domain-containing protein [Citrobacter sp. Cb004]MDM3357005.1 EthD domain-containing protein [Citrobacter sp. Cb004]